MKQTCCYECRKSAGYTLHYKTEEINFNNEVDNYLVVTAVCKNCGKEMTVKGLMDSNVKRIDNQYRKKKDLITIPEIQNLLEIYNLGKSTLSLALGFGEITITRYLEGQMPSKQYSDIMKNALYNPEYMLKKLNENKSKITSNAYSKASVAVNKMRDLKVVSDKQLCVIAYLFELLEEITPLMLQKLLYYVQGLSYVIKGRPMFTEDCVAWIHGPVYPEIYDLFSNFKYRPIKDERFTVFKTKDELLSDQDKQIIELIVDTFGMYSGKTLEKITHSEDPWKNARKDIEDGMPSNKLIKKSHIKAYFEKMNSKYDFHSENGLNKYIKDQLKKDKSKISKMNFSFIRLDS